MSLNLSYYQHTHKGGLSVTAIEHEALAQKISANKVLTSDELYVLVTSFPDLGDGNLTQLALASFDACVGEVSHNKGTIMALKPYFTPEVRHLLYSAMRQILEDDCHRASNSENQEPMTHGHLFHFLRSIEHLVEAATASVDTIRANMQLFRQGLEALKRAQDIMEKPYAESSRWGNKKQADHISLEVGKINKLTACCFNKPDGDTMEAEMISVLLDSYRGMLLELRAKAYF